MATGKKVRKLPVAPLATPATKKVTRKPLFEKTARNFRIGGSIRPRTDLSRFVKWPQYIRLQRQRRILLQRLKVPPALNQFNHVIDKNQARQLLRILVNYKPETRGEKKLRLTNEAERQVSGAQIQSKKPTVLKFGLNHVTDLVEIKKAKLVVIAHDVEPVELVVWLPALCRKKDVPYCIIKGKSRLGQLVHQKNTCVIAVDSVRREDQAEFDILCKSFKALFNDNVELRRRWGGGLLGIKSQRKEHKKEAALAIQQAKKMGLP